MSEELLEDEPLPSAREAGTMGIDGASDPSIPNGILDWINAPPSESEQDPELARDPEVDLDVWLQEEPVLPLAVLTDPLDLEQELSVSVAMFAESLLTTCTGA